MHTCVYRHPRRPEEKELDPLKLKLQVCVKSQDVGAGDQTWVLLKSSECS